MASLPAVILTTALKAVLCILLILLAAVLAVLFIPVRYRFRFSCGNEEKRKSLSADILTKETDADVRISWLLFIFGLSLVKKAGQKADIRVRILFFSFPLRHAAKPGRKKRPRRKKKTEDPDAGKKKERPSLKTRLSQFADACGKMDDRSFGRLVKKAAGRAGRFLRQILPKEASLSGIIGTGDPADTGKIFMMLGIFEGLDIRRIRISAEPDMDNAVCRLDGTGHGRLFLFRAVQLLLWALLDKDLRAFRRALKSLRGQPEKAKEEADGNAAADNDE